MPSNIEWVIKQACKIAPKRVLDIGIGFGQWGFLCRNYLETNKLPADWEIIVDGVEPNNKHVGMLQKIIYNKIYPHTVEEILPQCNDYDLVIVDAIKHLDKKVAWLVLNTLIKQNTWVLVTLPLGDVWLLNDFKDHPYLKRSKQVSNKLVLLFHNLKGTI